MNALVLFFQSAAYPIINSLLKVQTCLRIGIVIGALTSGLLNAQERMLIHGNDFEFELNALGSITGQGLRLLPDSSTILNHSGLWLCGLLSDSSIVGALNLSDTQHNYNPGPYHLLPGNTDAWNRVYKVNNQQIQQHIKDFRKEGYVAPEAIEQWPATRPNNRPFPIAPFVDWNSNGVYEPHLGEYPYIEGHSAAMSIFSNNVQNTPNPVGTPSGLECIHFNYLYTEPESKTQVILKRVIISHFGSQPIYNLRAGVFADIKLNAYPQQYIRSFPKWRAAGVYNSGRPQNTPPEAGLALSIQFLNSPLSQSMYIEHDSNSVTGMPNSVEEGWNYLNGKWRNGRNLFYGNNGVDGTAPARYVFPDQQDSLNQDFPWTEEDSGMDPAPKAILVSTHLGDIMPMQSIELRYVIIIGRSIQDSLAGIGNQLESILRLYEAGELSSIETNAALIKQRITARPNPVFRGTEIHFGPELSWVNKIKLIDAGGRVYSPSFESTPDGSIKIQAPPNPGMYTLKMIGYHGVSTARFIVQ